MPSTVHNPENIQFTATEEYRNQNIFTFKKLEFENGVFFSLKNSRSN